MSFPISIIDGGGQFTARLIGAPELTGVGPTRESAIDGLRVAVQKQVEAGQLATLDMGAWLEIAGNFADDPLLEDICREAYALRDSENEE